MELTTHNSFEKGLIESILQLSTPESVALYCVVNRVKIGLEETSPSLAENSWIIRDRYTIITSSSTFIIVVFHKLLDQSEACRRKAPNSNLVPQNSYTFVTFPSQNCHIEWTIFKNLLSLFHHKIMSLLVKCIIFFHHTKALVTFSSQNYAFVVSMYI